MTREQKILMTLIVVVTGIGGALYMTRGQAVNTVNTQSVTTDYTNNTPTTNTTSAAVNTTINTNTQTTIPAVKPIVTNPKPVTTTPAASKTVSSTISFDVPEHKTNTFSLNITTDNAGVITAVSYSENTSDRESKQYYDSFAKSFKTSSVVGKKISDVSLSRIGGASLTTKAFMTALADISSRS